MKQYLRRIERLEVKTGTDDTNTIWLSTPPENDDYTVKRVFPVTNQSMEKNLTPSEYRRFKDELEANNGRLIEVRWEA